MLRSCCGCYILLPQWFSTNEAWVQHSSNFFSKVVNVANFWFLKKMSFLVILIHCSRNRRPPSFCCLLGRSSSHRWYTWEILASLKHISTVHKGHEKSDFQHSISPTTSCFDTENLLPGIYSSAATFSIGRKVFKINFQSCKTSTNQFETGLGAFLHKTNCRWKPRYQQKREQQAIVKGFDDAEPTLRL